MSNNAPVSVVTKFSEIFRFKGLTEVSSRQIFLFKYYVL
jgi:hypothetical protein